MMRIAVITITALVMVITGTAMANYDKPFMQHDKWDRIQDINFQISTLNLVNGLYLSEDQLKSLLDLARQSKTALKEFKAEYAGTFKEMETAYKQLRNEVMVGTGISKTTKAKVETLHEKELQIQFAFGNKIGKLEEKAKNLLTENQLHVVKEFSPCLLPPQKLGEPTRAGQSRETDEIKNVLRNLREIQNEQWNAFKEILLESHVKKVEPVFGLRTKTQNQAEKKRMANIIERARAMNETTFEPKIDDLAREVIAPIAHLQASVRKIEPFAKRYHGFGKVGKLLLDPRCVQIYEERLIR